MWYYKPYSWVPQAPLKSTMTKLILTITLTITAVSLLTSGFVLAQDSNDKGTVLEGLDATAGSAKITKVGGTSGATTGLTTFVGIVINALFSVVAIIFLIVVMVGGFLWMTASGAEEQIKKAKKFIGNGVLGLMAVFLSYGLVYIILFSLNAATTK